MSILQVKKMMFRRTNRQQKLIEMIWYINRVNANMILEDIKSKVIY